MSIKIEFEKDLLSGEFEAKIISEVYSSENMRFNDIEEHVLEDLNLVDLPTDAEFWCLLENTCLELVISKRADGSAIVEVTISEAPKSWFGDIGIELYFNSYEELLLKYYPYEVKNFQMNLEPDRCSITYEMKFIAAKVMDIFDFVKELHTNFDQMIWDASSDAIELFWKRLSVDSDSDAN